MWETAVNELATVRGANLPNAVALINANWPTAVRHHMGLTDPRLNRRLESLTAVGRSASSPSSFSRSFSIARARWTDVRVFDMPCRPPALETVPSVRKCVLIRSCESVGSPSTAASTWPVSMVRAESGVDAQGIDSWSVGIGAYLLAHRDWPARQSNRRWLAAAWTESMCSKMRAFNSAGGRTDGTTKTLSGRPGIGADRPLPEGPSGSTRNHRQTRRVRPSRKCTRSVQYGPGGQQQPCLRRPKNGKILNSASRADSQGEPDEVLVVRRTAADREPASTLRHGLVANGGPICTQWQPEQTALYHVVRGVGHSGAPYRKSF